MPMNGNARGDTDYNAIMAANPNFSKLSPTEQNNLKHYFEVLFSADTGYIQSNADVLPASHLAIPLSNDAGQPSSGTDPQGGTVFSTTSSPQAIIGTGSIS